MTTVPVLQREIQARVQTPNALPRWLPVLGVAALLLVGGYLRLHDLGRRSISHPEMYVPGIHMPVGISQPRQRLTLTSVITGTFTSDTHPAGFYVMMWMWTKCFGAGIWSIRMPAALLGIGCIPLLLWLGFLVGQRSAAWMAAALLAVNAHHVFWSQTARMYSMACFLGLLATVLLLKFNDSKDTGFFRQIAYLSVLLVGVSAHVFFWVIWGTHAVWTLLNGWTNDRRMPEPFRVQMLALILGSPFFAFSAYQSGTVVAPLSDAVSLYAREFVQFAFLFPLQGFSSGLYLPSVAYPFANDAYLPFWRIGLLVISIALLLMGIFAHRDEQDPLAKFATGGPHSRVWIFTAVVACLSIVTFCITAHRVLGRAGYRTLRVTEAMIVLPLLFASLAVGLQHYWGRVWSNHFGRKMWAGPQGLMIMLAAIPFAVLAVGSKMRPILNARGMMLLDPYLLFLLATGIVWMSAKNRAVGIALVCALAVIHTSALREYRPMATDPIDYKLLISQVSNEYRRGDVIFLRPGIWSTPFLYYLNTDKYLLIGENYNKVSQQHADGRVWVIATYGEPLSEELRLSIQRRNLITSLNVPHAKALLFSSSD